MDGSKHTPSSSPADGATTFVERKVKADGRVKEYRCSLLALTPWLAVARFPLPLGGAPYGTPIAIPPGSSSDGYFWRRRPYVVYRFRGPDGTLLGHRIDAVADVRLRADAVEYRDLCLDWWLDGRGRLVAAEDRDEFDRALAAGLLSARDVVLTTRAERVALAPRRLLAELGRWERGLVGLSSP